MNYNNLNNLHTIELNIIQYPSLLIDFRPLKSLEKIIFNFVLFEINGMILDNSHFKNLQLNFNNSSKNYDPFDWIDKCRRFNVPEVNLNAKYKFVISKANQTSEIIDFSKLQES